MRKLAFLAALLLSTAAAAQSVQQSGTVTTGHVAVWAGNGLIKDGGTAANGFITSLGVVNNGGPGICTQSAATTAAGYNQLCLSASTSSSAVISLQNYGTATAQDLVFRLNGVDLILPSGGGNFVTTSGALVSGHLLCLSGTSGLTIDCGTGIGAGTQWGVPYYSATGTISSTGAFTNGQILVGQTGAAPTPRTLSGDVSSISAAGAVTLGSVNGVAFNSTYTANGVLIGNGTSAFQSVVTSNIGYCLQSQGLAVAPIWATCASGSGSAGGSNTQVQFNNASSLAGSANLTWISPALTIGVVSTTSGQVAFASSGGGTVTVQAPASVTNTFNFNLPNGAGSSGQPLLSGGGGSTAMSFGTLGTGAGGTNCASPSGTCLDNITGFASTGYINRTGAGTYAFSAQIPVSSGGTGLASGTSGGILGYTAAGTLASSAELVVNSVVIGGGAGATPTTITAATDGQILVGATSAAPAFKTLSGDISAVTSAGAVTIANSAISNAKLANSAAYTLKGNFTVSAAAPQDSTIGALTQKASPAAGDYLLIQDNAAAGEFKYATVSSIASAGSVASIAGNTGAFTLAAGVTNSVNQIQWDGAYTGYSNPNCTLTASAAAGALTIALKDSIGSDPTSASPCFLNFADATATSGTTSSVPVTGATSLAISSGSTLGVTSSTAFRVWIVAFNDAGTVRLGAINASTSTNIYPLNNGVVASSTAEGGAGAADSAGVIYTGTAVTSKTYRVLGYLEWSSTGLTAGTWTTTNLNYIRPYNSAMALPGQSVGNVKMGTLAGASGLTSTAMADVTNGSTTFTPTSAVNKVRVQFWTRGIVAAAGAGQNSVLYVQALRSSTVISGPFYCGVVSGSGTNQQSDCPFSAGAIDWPNSNASTTYKLQYQISTAGTPSATVDTINFQLEEIQG